MVTFSLPGDDVVDGSVNGTPRPRPPLPFAKRAFAASPFGGASPRRLGTPQSSSVRKTPLGRDDIQPSSVSRGSFATARNIFQASSISESPPISTFSPSLPSSTKKKVFAPSATPDAGRTYRESVAQATPRGMAAKVSTKELFSMKIPSPPSELTGEALADKVPKDWNSKGSIYADQYLAHACPPEFSDEQRRQFFCILDLRRLKYAADEIFCKKDWKLNIINFAKEFEKSRSIILLRYGLYEFRNVKPSKEVIKRWRREHGLPDQEDDVEADRTPSKPITTKKRKASDDVKESGVSGKSPNKSKRRAMHVDDEETAPVPEVAASPAKNKRKASVSEEVDAHPAKMHKPTPSAAKSLFEKAANKPAAPGPTSTANLGTNLSAKQANFEQPRSVFTGLQSNGASNNANTNNIFGHLSDSSAKNSGVEADGESETDSAAEEEDEEEEEESIGAGQSDEPDNSTAASQTGSGLFASKPAGMTGFGIESASAPGTRESTPGRSLFERVTKDNDGQAVRAEKSDVPANEPKAPADQTWNPSTTPIKFAPPMSAASAEASSLAGSSQPLFAPKSTTSSNMFGAMKPAPPQPVKDSKESLAPTAGQDTDKDGGESDKENESKGPKKPLFGSNVPAAPSTSGPSLFGSKPIPSDKVKEAESAKPASSLFGSAKPDSQPDTNKRPNMFGSVPQPEDLAAASAPVMQSSTLFGTKPSNTDKPSDTPKPTTSLFGGSSAPVTNTNASAANPFSSQPSTSTSNIFGGAAAASKPLFGAPIAGPSGTAAQTASIAAEPSKAPMFNFGGASTGVSKPDGPAGTQKPLFGNPISPPPNGVPKSLFDGSPMKQDEPSPAKRAFTGDKANNTPSSGLFNFGSQANTAPPTNPFGAATNPPASNGVSAAAGPLNPGSFNFNFNAGGTSNGAFGNPFSNGAQGGDKTPAFSFGSTPAPASGASSPFQFGPANGGSSVPDGGSLFGANQANDNAATSFGSSSGAAPAFSFGGAPSQAPSQKPGPGSLFGSSTPAPVFGGLQPPAGGASTTGTNSPFSLGGAGGSSLATTPAGGTPEPTSQAEEANGGDEGDEEAKQKQISLTDGLEADEEVLHEVRAKVLKFVPASDKSDDEEKPKPKSPWSTQGVGSLRLLKNKETNALRLLLRAEPRGHVAMNRTVLPDMSYKADAKYVKMTTASEKGDGLETWMIQVKTQDLAKELAAALEKHKGLNKK